MHSVLFWYHCNLLVRCWLPRKFVLKGYFLFTLAGDAGCQKLSCLYYDLGGIDEDKWPSLTTFKRQFKGEEFSYLGNIDILLKPVVYFIYNLVRRLKKLN